MANSEQVIGPASRVTLHYRMTMEDGTVADSSFDDEPVTFQLGEGVMLPNLEKLLLGLGAGDHKTFQLTPDEAFGYADTENFHYVARSEFPTEMDLEPGMVVGFEGPDGAELPGMVMDVGEESILVNFNHPLAGHDLTFEVEVLAVDTID
ncbi:MAG TPA: FKBP-type peptidyl-prolyl cis-trans isomerase [Gammaproteobacteria bacterium]